MVFALLMVLAPFSTASAVQQDVWHDSGAILMPVGMGGGNLVAVSNIAPFRHGQLIRVDNEVMIVLWVNRAQKWMTVFRWQPTGHIIFTPVFIRDLSKGGPIWPLW